MIRSRACALYPACSVRTTHTHTFRAQLKNLEHLKSAHSIEITENELEMMNMAPRGLGKIIESSGGDGAGRDNRNAVTCSSGSGNGANENERSDPLTPCYQEACHRKIMKETTRKFLHAFNSSQVTTKTDQILLVYE